MEKCLGSNQGPNGAAEPLAVEEMKATELEFNEGRMETGVGHYSRVPHIKDRHLLTTLQSRASEVQDEFLKEAIYAETIRTTEDQSRDKHQP
jgi:hypothetical protein